MEWKVHGFGREVGAKGAKYGGACYENKLIYYSMNVLIWGNKHTTWKIIMIVSFLCDQREEIVSGGWDLACQSQKSGYTDKFLLQDDDCAEVVMMV